MQKNAELVRAMMDFAEAHNMIGKAQWIRGESDLENFVFDEKTIIFLTDSANISRQDGRPIYTMSYIVAVVDKGASSGELGMNSAVEENLFVLGQLQDYLGQQGFDVDIEDVDVQTDFDDSGDLVVVSTNMTANLSRNSANKDINL